MFITLVVLVTIYTTIGARDADVSRAPIVISLLDRLGRLLMVHYILFFSTTI
jgi:hypothetical protein